MVFVIVNISVQLNFPHIWVLHDVVCQPVSVLVNELSSKWVYFWCVIVVVIFTCFPSLPEVHTISFKDH